MGWTFGFPCARHHLVHLVYLRLSPLIALNTEVARAGDLSYLLCSAISRETQAEYMTYLLTEGMSFDYDGRFQASQKVSTQ